MTGLLAILLILNSGDPVDAGSDDLFGVFFKGNAAADIREGLSTLRADSLAAYPSAFYSDDVFQLEATVEANYSVDSTEAGFRPVSAGGFFTWPGSPWVSAGVFKGLRTPFLYGITSPVSEWGALDVMEENGVTAEAGGILGFDGFWNQYGDSLSWYGISSPWLGFGMVSWNCFETDSSKMVSYSGFMDLRVIQPWVMVTDTDSVFSGEVEVRGWKPEVSSLFSVEVVPGFYWCEDSSSVSLGGLFHSSARAVSGDIHAVADTDDLESTSLSGNFYMLSEAGLEWTVQSSLVHLEDFSGSITCLYPASSAGCGGIAGIEDDSLYATAIALYSPVSGVSSRLAVTTDLDWESPDPSCEFGVFGGFSRGLAGFSVIWEEGTTVLNLGVSAWID